MRRAYFSPGIYLSLTPDNNQPFGEQIAKYLYGIPDHGELNLPSTSRAAVLGRSMHPVHHPTRSRIVGSDCQSSRYGARRGRGGWEVSQGMFFFEAVVFLKQTKEERLMLGGPGGIFRGVEWRRGPI